MARIVFKSLADVIGGIPCGIEQIHLQPLILTTEFTEQQLVVCSLHLLVYGVYLRLYRLHSAVFCRQCRKSCIVFAFKACNEISNRFSTLGICLLVLVKLFLRLSLPHYGITLKSVLGEHIVVQFAALLAVAAQFGHCRHQRLELRLGHLVHLLLVHRRQAVLSEYRILKVGDVLYVPLVPRCVVYCGHKLLQSEHTVLQRLLRLEAFALDLLLIFVPCAYSFSHASIHVLRHT
ncbi:unknown [Prevotella sp. CAG:279]|nr:unknown [Prevotella sp. CAG:279]